MLPAAAAAATAGGIELGVDGAGDGTISRGASLGDGCLDDAGDALAAAPAMMAPAAAAPAAPATRGPGEDDGRLGAGLETESGRGAMCSTGVDGAGPGIWIGKKLLDEGAGPRTGAGPGAGADIGAGA